MTHDAAATWSIRASRVGQAGPTRALVPVRYRADHGGERLQTVRDRFRESAVEPDPACEGEKLNGR
jgi:hypothetical protein